MKMQNALHCLRSRRKSNSIVIVVISIHIRGMDMNLSVCLTNGVVVVTATSFSIVIKITKYCTPFALLQRPLVFREPYPKGLVVVQTFILRSRSVKSCKGGETRHNCSLVTQTPPWICHTCHHEDGVCVGLN